MASGGSSTGTLTIAGASVTDGGDMTVGDQGTATVNMVPNSGATLTVHGTLYLSRSIPPILPIHSKFLGFRFN
jgi:hypothetical protein